MQWPPCFIALPLSRFLCAAAGQCIFGDSPDWQRQTGTIRVRAKLIKIPEDIMESIKAGALMLSHDADSELYATVSVCQII